MKGMATFLVAVIVLSSFAGIAGEKNMLLSGMKMDEIKESIAMETRIVSDGDYKFIAGNGMKYMHIAGEPMLPYETKTYFLPSGSVIKSIDIVPERVERVGIDGIIKPAPVPVSDFTNEMKLSSTYTTNEFYPSGFYDYHIGVGIKNGMRYVIVDIFLYPYRYNPVEKTLLNAQSFKINIAYEPGSGERSVDNYDLLIIAPDKWLDSLQPLVEHKNSHGVKTKLVGLSEALKENGRDDAEKVKYFIKDEIENDGIKYVMLVGGRHGGILNEKWWVPVRYSHLDDDSNYEASYLSDLYFADIYKYEDGKAVFDDWDSNGNGIYAEWSFHGKDILDLHPDVYVGRLACRNEYEVKLMVNKIIEYETGDAANKPWFKRMVLVGGDSWPDKDDPYYEGEEENKVAMDVMHGFNYTTLWTSDGTLTGAEDVINAVSKGCGFLFFDGHGNPMSWATHPPHDENTWITGLLVSDMSKLSNNGMYPVCIVGACHNSQFNVSVLNLLKPGEFYKTYYRSEWSPECWSWWIVRKANGGAIASLGYAGLDYFAIGDSDKDGIPDCTQYFSGFMNTHFFMNYANGTNIIGNIQGNVLNEYIDYSNPWKDKTSCKTIEEWVLLGDPSLKIGGYSS